MLLDQKTQEIVAEIPNYNIPITREHRLELFTDGLCENPGAMHIGLFARQGNRCLFTRHTFVGHGTCNEAEYSAVKTGLVVLQALFPSPASLLWSLATPNWSPTRSTTFGNRPAK